MHQRLWKENLLDKFHHWGSERWKDRKVYLISNLAELVKIDQLVDQQDSGISLEQWLRFKRVLLSYSLIERLWNLLYLQKSLD
jgi:hypothetical protein